MTARRPAVFLDRDGVLNEGIATTAGAPRPPRSRDELAIVPECAALLERLRRAEYALIVVTNQPDIARGAVTARAVQDIHDELESVLPIQAVYCCPHDSGDGCECRKPAPGMLHAAERDHSLDLERSWLIGDRWVDIAAARGAGVRAVLIEHPWSWEATSSGSAPPDLAPDVRVRDLREAVAAVLESDAQKS